MALYEHFPYTNFHELNLADLMAAVKELEEIIGQFNGDIDAAVAAYISQHPEIMITPDSVYTAALQDGAVTKEKVDPALGVDYVTPQMYKTPDNTWRDAFNAALDSGMDVFVPTANGEQYIIDGPAPIVSQGITIPQPALIWPNSGCKRLFGSDSVWRTVSTSGAIVFRPYNDASSENQPFIQLQGGAHGLRISNLRFVRSGGYGNNTTGIGLDALYDTTSADKDLIITNSCFNDFHTGIAFGGRGLQVYDSTFSSGQYAARIQWPNAFGTDDNGSRGIVFSGCRFHVNNYADIWVQSGHAHGLNVTGCYKDRRTTGGRTFIRADSQAWGWNISGNSLIGLYASGTNLNTIEFMGGAVGCTISGNTFQGFPDDADGTHRGPLAAIYFGGGTVNGVVISGNSFYRIRQHCVRIQDCTSFRGLVFTGNSCNISSSASSYGGVYLGINTLADEFVVMGNRMDLLGSSPRVYVKNNNQPAPTNLVLANNITI